MRASDREGRKVSAQSAQLSLRILGARNVGCDKVHNKKGNPTQNHNISHNTDKSLPLESVQASGAASVPCHPTSPISPCRSILATESNTSGTSHPLPSNGSDHLRGPAFG
jgi:hypothetical protein